MAKLNRFRKPATAKTAGPPKRQASPSTVEELDEDDSAVAPTSDMPSDDMLSFGEDADQRIKNYQESAGRPRTLEFFITKKEVSAGGGKASARVHLAFNYADKKYKVSAPFVTIKTAGGFDTFPSPGEDCAIAQAGVNPSVKPIYILVDHRSYVDKEGNQRSDLVKKWIPAAGIASLMEDAIENLCENLGEDRSNIDLRNYELSITKSGTGRQTSWSLAFIVKKKAMTSDHVERIGKFFGNEEGEYPDYAQYVAFLKKMLQPDPRYMISKGGKYVKPASVDDSKESRGELPFN